MFPQLSLAGTPLERGRQYGAAAAPLVRHSIASYASLFAYRRGLNWAEVGALALAYLPLLEELMPDLVAEMRGVAQGAGVGFAEIVALNARTELLAGAAPGAAHSGQGLALERNRAADVPDSGECTTVAALPEATAGGQTLLAQTWDWTGNQRAACVVLRIAAPGQPAVLTVTEAGILAKIGINDAGLAVSLNILRSRNDGQAIGMPVHLLLRNLLQARSFDEALALAHRARPGASSCVTIASAEGRAVSLELTPGGVRQVGPQEGLLAHTNHCLDPEARAGEAPFDAASSTEPRYERARTLLQAARGTIDVPTLMAILRDEQGAPFAICRHPNEALHPLDRVESVLGTVMDVGNGTMYLAPGVPSAVDFVPLQI